MINIFNLTLELILTNRNGIIDGYKEISFISFSLIQFFPSDSNEYKNIPYSGRKLPSKIP